jgi:glycolate oxidase iron-sulfur subunit
MDAFFPGPDIRATLELLNGLGIRAAIPPGQVCCGALDQHLGRLGEAAQLQAQNRRELAGSKPVLVLDSGCEAQLREYPAEGWQGRVTSLTGFLARLPIEDFRWRREPVRVALHLPCTLRNVNRETEGIRQVFQRLPGVELTALAPPRNCCGAGGTAMLTQPVVADRLGLETLQALLAPQPDVIVSPNVGCSVHLRALHKGGAPRIVSPARFLYERLSPAPS